MAATPRLVMSGESAYYGIITEGRTLVETPVSTIHVSIIEAYALTIADLAQIAEVAVVQIDQGYCIKTLGDYTSAKAATETLSPILRSLQGFYWKNYIGYENSRCMNHFAPTYKATRETGEIVYVTTSEVIPRELFESFVHVIGVIADQDLMYSVEDGNRVIKTLASIEDAKKAMMIVSRIADAIRADAEAETLEKAAVPQMVDLADFEGVPDGVTEEVDVSSHPGGCGC